MGDRAGVASKLTKTQEKMLADVRAAGVKRYNGRAERTVKALALAGLIEYDFDLHLAAIGKATVSYTVRSVKGASDDEATL